MGFGLMVAGIVVFAVIMAFIFIPTPAPKKQDFQNLNSEQIGGISVGVLALGAIILVVYTVLQRQTAAALRKYGL